MKSDNIDLFAAGPRRPQMKPLQPPITSSPPSSSAGIDGRRSVQDMASSPGLRNSMTELQAELLRLEAEKEQLEIDKQNLDTMKVNNPYFFVFITLRDT